MHHCDLNSSKMMHGLARYHQEIHSNRGWCPQRSFKAIWHWGLTLQKVLAACPLGFVSRFDKNRWSSEGKHVIESSQTQKSSSAQRIFIYLNLNKKNVMDYNSIQFFTVYLCVKYYQVTSWVLWVRHGCMSQRRELCLSPVIWCRDLQLAAAPAGDLWLRTR